MLVNRAMLAGAGAGMGSVAEFVLEPDMEPRPAELPEELAALLDEEEGLRDFYDSFSESMRREIGKWVLGVKGDEARLRRAQQMAERLLGAMEGEKELPPVVAAAFRRRPKAKAGWEKLSVLRRRQELLAVFYYKTPESVAKRVEKLCDLAEGEGAGQGRGWKAKRFRAGLKRVPGYRSGGIRDRAGFFGAANDELMWGAKGGNRFSGTWVRLRISAAVWLRICRCFSTVAPSSCR